MEGARIMANLACDVDEALEEEKEHKESERCRALTDEE